MRRAWKVALVVVVLLFGGLLVLGLANDELRTFAMVEVAPSHARDSLLRRFEKSGSEIYLLGTIHGGHLDTPEYAFTHLEAVLLHLRPERLLVESRPEQVAEGNLGDGPVEMTYMSLVARAEQIPFDGIDWWDENNTSARRTDANRDDRMAQNLMERVPPSGKVLVLVGFSHVSEQARRLRDQGYEEKEIAESDRAALFDTTGVSNRFPAGMAAAIERRIARDESLIEGGNAERAERLRSAIAARRELLARVQREGEREPVKNP